MGKRIQNHEDILFDEAKNLIETSIEYHFETFSLVTSTSPTLPRGFFPREDFLFDEEKNSLLSAIPLPLGFFPREDFLFDEEKNSLLSLEVAMRFSLRQIGNPHEENFLVGGGGGKGKEREDFLFDEAKNLIETSIEYHFEIFTLVTSTSPTLPRGFFPREDFLFDEEKNSLLSAIPPPTRIFSS